jgi:hypothetical protein
VEDEAGAPLIAFFAMSGWGDDDIGGGVEFAAAAAREARIAIFCR